MYILILLYLFFQVTAPTQQAIETHITGVYQGQTLFIQNPFHPDLKTFCIQKVLVNDRSVPFNSKMSAIKLDFDGLDLYTPVSVRIIQKDSCDVIVINPNAINFHSTFSFEGLQLTDTAMVWSTIGDKEGGVYTIEKYDIGIWKEEHVIDSKGKFEGADYSFFPDMNEGANKYRIKYTYPNGKYIYSNELDFHYYPEPVKYSPKAAKNELTLSRPSPYEIYDMGGEMVLSGQGLKVDVSGLKPGDYIISFDGVDPSVFSKIR